MDPHIDVNVSSSAPSGSNRATSQGYQENIIPLVSGQTYIHEGHDGGSNAEHYYRDINSSTPNHLEGRSVKPENPFALHDGINSSMSKREKGKRKRRRKKNKEDHMVRAANENGEIDGNTDNHTELCKHKNGDHSVPKERTENPNDESKYDEQKGTEKETKYNSNEEQRSTSSKIEFYRDATSSDVQAMFPPVQDRNTDFIHGSDEVHTELNTSNSESRIEETKKRKRSGKRNKIKKNTLFDVPADYPVVEEQTDINNPGSRIN